MRNTVLYFVLTFFTWVCAAILFVVIQHTATIGGILEYWRLLVEELLYVVVIPSLMGVAWAYYVLKNLYVKNQLTSIKLVSIFVVGVISGYLLLFINAQGKFPSWLFIAALFVVPATIPIVIAAEQMLFTRAHKVS